MPFEQSGPRVALYTQAGGLVAFLNASVCDPERALVFLKALGHMVRRQLQVAAGEPEAAERPGWQGLRWPVVELDGPQSERLGRALSYLARQIEAGREPFASLAAAEQLDSTWSALRERLSDEFPSAQPFPTPTSHLLRVDDATLPAPRGPWHYTLLVDCASAGDAPDDALRLWLTPPLGGLRPGEGAAALHALGRMLQERAGLSSSLGGLPTDPEPAPLAAPEPAPPAGEATAELGDSSPAPCPKVSPPTPLVLRVRCSADALVSAAETVRAALPALLQEPGAALDLPPASAAPVSSLLEEPRAPTAVGPVGAAPRPEAPLLETLGRGPRSHAEAPPPAVRPSAPVDSPHAGRHAAASPRLSPSPRPPAAAPAAPAPPLEPLEPLEPLGPTRGHVRAGASSSSGASVATAPRRLDDLRRARSLGLPPPPAWPSHLDPSATDTPPPPPNPAGELLVDWPDDTTPVAQPRQAVEAPLDEALPVDLVLLSRGPFPTRVKRVLALLLSTDYRDAERLLTEAPTVILPGAEVVVARRYAQALGQAGARLRIEQARSPRPGPAKRTAP